MTDEAILAAIGAITKRWEMHHYNAPSVALQDIRALLSMQDYEQPKRLSETAEQAMFDDVIHKARANRLSKRLFSPELDPEEDEFNDSHPDG
jgi:hypothetical protein